VSIESIAAMAIDSPVSSGDPRDRWHRHEMSLGAMWLLLALGLRWIAADHDLSFDEIWILAGLTVYGSACTEIPTDELVVTPILVTARENARSPLEVWTRGVTFHPPTQLFSLWWWRAVFGGSDWIAVNHLAIWPVVSNGFVFSTFRMQAGFGPAPCLALMMALSPVQSQLGRDIRGYGMVLGLVARAARPMGRIE